MKLQTPKGFRDFLPSDALRRQFVLDKIIRVFQTFGFDPLETPTLEYLETLMGKYGEEEKLIYQFETSGGDKVALKYDQTVPLARVIAQYGPKGEQKLVLPFKRYQIQPAYRGENTQKGRYREFLQCDADIVGSSSTLADAEILMLVGQIYQALDLKVIIKVNDRSLLADVEPKYLSAIDKLLKIGEEGVIQELIQKGLKSTQASQLLNQVRELKPTLNLSQSIKLARQFDKNINLQFDPTLVRGLNYYTGIIIEVVLKDKPLSSSLGGGGRYDNLIGSMIGDQINAVGFSVGLDRTIEAMEEAGVLNQPTTNTKVLVTIFSPDLTNKSLEVSSRLRSNNVPTEVWLEPSAKLDKQLKYADQKKIPYVVIIGPDEAKSHSVKLKDFVKNSQTSLSLDELLSKLSS